MDTLNSQAAELEQLLKDLNQSIDRLHNEYNKYFAGAEKRMPLAMREQVDKKFTKAQTLQRQIQNPSLNFRSQTVFSKYASYKAMWDKKIAQSEGT